MHGVSLRLLESKSGLKPRQSQCGMQLAFIATNGAVGLHEWKSEKWSWEEME